MQINICHHQISLIMTSLPGANAIYKELVGFGNLFSAVLGSWVNEKLCNWHRVCLLTEEQGLMNQYVDTSVVNEVEKITWKLYCMKPQRAQSQLRCPKERQCWWFEHTLSPFPPLMLIISFVSSSIQWRVVHGSESTCVNLMLKNAQKQDIIYSNHTFRKSSTPSLWSGQAFSRHTPSALGLWSRREERLSHLPGYLWAQRNEASPDTAESTRTLAEVLAQRQHQRKNLPDG